MVRFVYVGPIDWQLTPRCPLPARCIQPTDVRILGDRCDWNRRRIHPLTHTGLSRAAALRKASATVEDIAESSGTIGVRD